MESSTGWKQYSGVVFLGFLVGLLLGLSVSETVGIILGGLTALIATVLGLTEFRQKSENSEEVKLKVEGETRREKVTKSAEESESLVEDTHNITTKWRSVDHVYLGVFAICCIVGMIGGIWARTHDFLSPTKSDLLTEWINLGIDSTLARQIVIYQELNPSQLGTELRIMSDWVPSGIRTNKTVLFQTIAPEECENLWLLSISESDSAFREIILGINNPLWKKLGELTLDDSELKAVVGVLCEKN